MFGTTRGAGPFETTSCTTVSGSTSDPAASVASPGTDHAITVPGGTTSSNCSIVSTTEPQAGERGLGLAERLAGRFGQLAQQRTLADHHEERLALGQLDAGRGRGANDLADLGPLVAALALDVDLPVVGRDQVSGLGDGHAGEVGHEIGRALEQLECEDPQRHQRAHDEQPEQDLPREPPSPARQRLGLDRRRLDRERCRHDAARGSVAVVLRPGAMPGIVGGVERQDHQLVAHRGGGRDVVGQIVDERL